MSTLPSPAVQGITHPVIASQIAIQNNLVALKVLICVASFYTVAKVFNVRKKFVAFEHATQNFNMKLSPRLRFN